MPARFTRLRLVGFKSFAEPVLIEILPGLTGIVGPNGCGKSNVVEALRFTMGESSTRAMRTGELEDVIFAGTAARPARNLAEVTLTLEAGTEPLPVPYHEAAEVAISRGVERGRGSTFRLNGREVRARDVQTLFADLGSGPRSSAMIGQDRIAALIAARPEDRRVLLEEAAGITGLHARRHEAELKLAAAEANLARAEELKATLEQELAGLKRQARQAARFRNLGGAIQAAAAELLAIERARAAAARAAAAAALAEARLTLADGAAAAATAATHAAAAAARLPEQREAEAAGRTTLERTRLAREQIAAEEARARASLAAATTRLAELDRDLSRSAALAADAASAEARLATEDEELAAAAALHPGREAAADAALTAAAALAAAAVAATDQAADHAAALGARAAALDEEQRRLSQRLARLAGERIRVENEQAVLAATEVDADRLAAAADAESAAESALAATRAECERLATERATATAAHESARARLAEAEAERARAVAEADALSAVLAAGGEVAADGPPLADSLSVPAGLEAAFAAAFGETLEASHRRWHPLPPLADAPPLPASAAPLGALLAAPAPALARALALIGLVENPAEAPAVQASLVPGQALVSRDGGLWRWDGYRVRPGTTSAAAVRLVERNRLALLRHHLAAAEAAAAAARSERADLAAAEQAMAAAAARAEAARREADGGFQCERRAGEQLRRDAAAAAIHATALGREAARIAAEFSELEESLARLAAERAALPDPTAARAALEAARTALAEAHAREARARTEQAATAERSATLAARRRALAIERSGWSERRQAAADQAADLTARRVTAAVQAAALEGLPAELALRQGAAITALEAAEAAHRETATRLAAADQAAAALDRAARAAERGVNAAREQELLGEGSLAQATAALEVLDRSIRERLGDAPLPEPDRRPDAEIAARHRLERLLREREAMGPVNLRAEIEAAELEERIGGITREGLELTTAIAKLRGSVGHLNREGRARLSSVFTTVDRHFQALFARMFGGGRAHLALVGSDDPLAAGLELYAQPPGKKLAQLSLLSGGEQALVALSVIFAVFRCNPAPLAVLDEVDAPLDDVNVGRFCALIEDMVRECGTRMLVVTHHPLTMARMDRLYGVTMQERGISRLISVDLARATELAEPPRMAAE